MPGGASRGGPTANQFSEFQSMTTAWPPGLSIAANSSRASSPVSRSTLSASTGVALPSSAI